MKKILVISGLMMAAIVALTGCQKEQNFIDRSFTVTASTDNGTKTTNDGLSTLWAEGDKISVFYKTGDSYSDGIAMTLSDGAGTKGGVFAAAAGSAEIPSGTKDWYAIYPSGPKSPASVDKDGGYTYVGNRNGLTQQGYDDTSILSGNSCPMYGVAKDVSGNPAFTMKQLASVIEFNIVNKTDAPVKINKVTLDESESDEAIVGSFYVDFTGEKPEFVKSGDDYVSTKAFTSVANAPELAVDATAKVYMPLVPFAHDPMKTFFVLIDGEVNGSAFTSTVALHPTADKCLFEAGKIKRVNVPLEELEAVNGDSVADVAGGTVGDSYIVRNALVTMVYNKGFFVQDNSGSILVFMNATPEVSKGDKVDISGVTSTYSNMVQFKQPTVTVKSSGNEVSLPEPVAYTGTEVDAAAATATNAYVSLTATATSATAATVEGATATLALNASSDLDVTITSGKTYNLTGYVYGYYNNKVYFYVDSAEEAGGDTPGPGPSSTTIADVHAAASGTELTVDDVIVSAVFPQGFFVTDNTDILYVFLKAAPSVQIGDKVSVGGKVSVYKGNKQINNDPAPTITPSGNGSVTLSPAEWTGSDVSAAYADNNAKYVKLKATATSTTIATVDGAGDRVLYIANAQKAAGVTIEKDKTYNLTGYVYGHGTYSNTEQIYFYAESAEEVTDTPGPGPEPEGTLVEVVMKDFVANNSYTVSSGNTVTCYRNLDLSPAVRLSTTGAGNCGSFWGDSTIDWRLYQAQNGNAIITVAEGCTLQLVQFTFTTSNNGVLKYGDEVVETGKGIECSGNQVEFTVGNSGDKTNGQIKITAVKVIYTGSGTLPPIEPGETETKITMANTNSVYVGETVALGATANVDATITYESADTSIATVDASGVVTGVAAGSVKVYARVAANEGHWTAAEKYCTVTVNEKPVAQEGIWTEFGISNIQEGDEFVIVGNGYAMSNSNGTSTAPAAVAVTISNNNITTEVTNEIVWTLSVDAQGLYTFYPKGTTEKWLYCNTTASSKSNDNMRVGTGDRKVFAVEVTEVGCFLVTKDDYTARYVSVYNNADWRGYVSKDTANTPIRFFKKATRP